jgi:hypothetical protein
MKHLMSITGDPSNASILSIRIVLPSIDSILHMDMAIKLGLKGEWVANTPVKGFFLLLLGWT